MTDSDSGKLDFRPTMDPDALDIVLAEENIGSIQWHAQRNARVVLRTGDKPLIELDITVLEEILDKTYETQRLRRQRLFPKGEFPEYRTDFESDEQARDYVDFILEGSFGERGIRSWWDRKRHQLSDRTPNEVWPIDQKAVIDLAYGGMSQSAT